MIALPAMAAALAACSDDDKDANAEPKTPAPDTKVPEARGDVDMANLLEPGALPEKVLGKDDAPVTMVEYASMTCSHCAHFHKETLPAIKEKYIDTGKVRFIMREFPLDNLAAAASMLARCVPADKVYPAIGLFFETQAEWAFVQDNPVAKLFEIAKQAGFTKDSFDKCLTNQKLLDQINAQRARASNQFGVSATPTFFINGKKLQSAPTVEAFDGMIEPLLK